MRLRHALFFIAAGLSSAAHADQWQVDPTQSELSFEVKIAGKSVLGGFEDWTADIQYEENAPQEGTVRVNVKTASAWIERSDAQRALTSPAWLAADQHPTAVFEAEGFRLGPEMSYTLSGELSLRGQSYPITLSGTLIVKGDHAQADVNTQVLRTQFNIGDSSDHVAFVVDVHSKIVASRVSTLR